MTDWMDMTEQELLTVLGEKIAARRRDILPSSSEQKIAEAMRWLDKNMDALRSTVCSNEKIQNYAAIHEVQLLFDATCEIITHITLNLPAGCVAAYLVRRGIGRLCEKEWSTRT